MSNAAEAALLDLLFLNIDWANVGDAAGLQNSAAAGSFYLSLHTADPGEAGDATTNEVAYTNYARVAVARSGAGFSRSGNVISNAALVQFPTCGVTGATATHWAVSSGTDGTGAEQIIVSGALGSSLVISNTIQPQFAIGALQATAE
jgi:hypothetical protein